MEIFEALAKEFNIREEYSKNLITLLDEGGTIPFIARYRKEMHGSLDDQVIREFADRLAKVEKICPHFHLSLQSGCNTTLKRMNRRYTAEEYYEKCQLLRKYFDNPALTTDVIVGFPGETEEEFSEHIWTLMQSTMVLLI